MKSKLVIIKFFTFNYGMRTLKFNFLNNSNFLVLNYLNKSQCSSFNLITAIILFLINL